MPRQPDEASCAVDTSSIASNLAIAWTLAYQSATTCSTFSSFRRLFGPLPNYILLVRDTLRTPLVGTYSDLGNSVAISMTLKVTAREPSITITLEEADYDYGLTASTDYWRSLSAFRVKDRRMADSLEKEGWIVFEDKVCRCTVEIEIGIGGRLPCSSPEPCSPREALTMALVNALAHVDDALRARERMGHVSFRRSRDTWERARPCFEAFRAPVQY